MVELSSCIDTVTEERKVCARVDQKMSSECSASKKMARDILFTAFAYRRLQSRLSVRPEEQKNEKAKEVSTVKAKLISKGTTGDIDFSHWRLAEVLEVCNTGAETALKDLIVEVPTDNSALLSHEPALRVFHE